MTTYIQRHLASGHAQKAKEVVTHTYTHMSQGRLVSFKNAIIIMTSNLGSAEMYREHSSTLRRRQQLEAEGKGEQSARQDAELRERMKELVMEQVGGMQCLPMDWLSDGKELGASTAFSKEKWEGGLAPLTGQAMLRAKLLRAFESPMLACLQVRKHFRPEFVNRVDEFIIFEPLR